MVPTRLILGLFAAMAFSRLDAEIAIFPLKDVRQGLHGVGKTVFSGTRIEEFQVEILGVLENVGPKQSVILARLSGGPLERTGVMQGMSGSPVYIDGRLVGAVALAFNFAKEPIAGIQPIEQMLDRGGQIMARREPLRVSLSDHDLTALLPRRESPRTDPVLIDIATPVSFSGFTRGTIERFGDQFRSLGLEPRQGISGGRATKPEGKPATLDPGSMISVQLLTGDLNVGADGTVTCIDGKKIYAFGHRFLAMGATELPFARAEVVALLPNLSASFKISTAREWLGAITSDRSAAIEGELGREAAMTPVSIAVTPAAGPPIRYQIEMAKDRTLAPFLLQTAIYSAIDATERMAGGESFRVEATVEFSGGVQPLKLQNVYSGDGNVAAQVALGIALPVAYVLQSRFDALDPKSVDLRIASFERRKQLQIEEVWTSRREARPGDRVEIYTLLAGDNGSEITRTSTFSIPTGAPLGPLYFTVADGNSTNLVEYQQLIGVSPKSPANLIAFLNHLRGNDRAYVRVWRNEPSYQVQGEDFPDPPPSLALILARGQGAFANPWQGRGSKVAELEVTAGDYLITGSKTAQVEVKE